jgi:lactoylglutathione lyase
MKSSFLHTNINVLDLEKSLAFYGDALGLHEAKRVSVPDGSFVLVFLSDGTTDYQMELTWLRDRKEPYDLGDNEWHVAFRMDDPTGARKKHGEMDCICFENKEMGIYFIEDPDGYWLEIIP